MGVHKRVKAKQTASATPSRQALGLVESAWLFTRGDQSVRIVRVGHREAGPRLLVHGPGTTRVVHDFDDMLSCTIHQSELERRLVARSFRLLRFMELPAVGRTAPGPQARVVAPAMQEWSANSDLTPSA